eukprot:SAG22_NODE_83_length_21704_cov_58.556584_15_plen_347_part_00
MMIMHAQLQRAAAYDVRIVVVVTSSTYTGICTPAPAMGSAGPPEGLASQWREQGFVVLRALFAADRAAQLAAISERIAAQWRDCSPETNLPGGDADATCMRHLNHPDYFERGADRIAMLEAVADERVLGVCEAILGERACFRSTSFFMNPESSSTNGHWHRDAPLDNVPKSPVPTAEEEDLIRANVGGGGAAGGCVQLQVALVPSDDVELVPASHLRWDTPAEWECRLGGGGANRREDGLMPGAERIALSAGDALAFNPFCHHRGRYHADKKRRTLMISMRARRLPLYDYFSDQPWCEDDGYLSGLSQGAARFWREFIADYSAQWQGGNVAALRAAGSGRHQRAAL